MDIVLEQLADVQRRYPQAHVEPSPDGQRVLVVPEVPVAEGWNLPAVTVRVLVPMGYPQVNLDCFYAEQQLALASGAAPTNSSIQPILGGQYRWFSWHLGNWDAGNASLDQYVRFCERRLKDPQ
jgi:Prokaryotic E2 family E